MTALRFQQSQQQIHESGFARPGSPDDGNGTAHRNIDGSVLENLYPVVIAEGQISDGNPLPKGQLFPPHMPETLLPGFHLLIGSHTLPNRVIGLPGKFHIVHPA